MGQFEDMAIFIKIVEAGGISRAAEQLGIAKSAVSRRLGELERRLGVQLMNRSTRRYSLTEAGRNYYARAAQILSDTAELDAEISERQGLLRGSVRMSLPLSFGLQHLAPAIIDFACQHPDLTVDIDFSDRHVDLIEEGYDLAIRITDPKSSTLIARKLTPIHFVLCASPAYLERRGEPRHPDDLADHDGVFYSNVPERSWTLISPQGREFQASPHMRMSASNGDFLREAAIAGLGITRSPLFLVRKVLEEGRLKAVLADYTIPGLNAYALYPQTRFLSRRVRAIIDMIVDACRKCA